MKLTRETEAKLLEVVDAGLVYGVATYVVYAVAGIAADAGCDERLGKGSPCGVWHFNDTNTHALAAELDKNLREIAAKGYGT